MAYSEADIPQIRFRLRLHPRPSWELTALPRPPIAAFQGPASKGKGGRGEDIEEERE